MKPRRDAGKSWGLERPADRTYQAIVQAPRETLALDDRHETLTALVMPMHVWICMAVYPLHDDPTATCKAVRMEAMTLKASAFKALSLETVSPKTLAGKALLLETVLGEAAVLIKAAILDLSIAKASEIIAAKSEVVGPQAILKSIGRAVVPGVFTSALDMMEQWIVRCCAGGCWREIANADRGCACR